MGRHDRQGVAAAAVTYCTVTCSVHRAAAGAAHTIRAHRPPVRPTAQQPFAVDKAAKMGSTGLRERIGGV